MVEITVGFDIWKYLQFGTIQEVISKMVIRFEGEALAGEKAESAKERWRMSILKRPTTHLYIIIIDGKSGYA
jgi:hypothetical protein